MPIMKIGLDEETHRRFKVWCASNGRSMAAAVGGLIREKLARVDEPGLDWRVKVGATPAAGATEYRYKPDDCGFHNFKTSGGKRVCVKCGFKDE